MTERQIRYREYLESDHWKALREQVFDRDGRKCIKCGFGQHIQAHHKFYRGRWEDAIPDDLETLCRKCHGAEHGFGPTAFERQCRKMEREMAYQRRPSKSDWFELMALMGCDEDWEDFGALMFHFVSQVAFEQNPGVEWWMDAIKRDYYDGLARRVRKSIRNRIKQEVSHVR